MDHLRNLFVGSGGTPASSLRTARWSSEFVRFTFRFQPSSEVPLDLGGSLRICTALKAFQADTGIQRKGCRAFANLGEFQVSREAIRREGGGTASDPMTSIRPTVAPPSPRSWGHGGHWGVRLVPGREWRRCVLVGGLQV